MARRPRWLGRDTVRAPYLTLCLSEQEFVAAAKHCDITSPGEWMDEDRHKAVTHTWGLKNGRMVCVVCLSPKWPDADPVDVACTLVHEAVHVVQRLCDSIGEGEPGREFEAYAVERVSEQLMREFSRRQKQLTGAE